MVKSKKLTPKKRGVEEIEKEKFLIKAKKIKKGTSENGEDNSQKLSSDAHKNQKDSKKRKMTADQPNKKQLKTKHENEKQGDWLTYKVRFPYGATCYKNAIMKVLNSCDSVFHPPPIIIKFASKEQVGEKLGKLKKEVVGADHLYVEPTVPPSKINKTQDPLKRVISLEPNFKNTDELKEFYDAKEVEQAYSSKGNLSNKFILTFESEAQAAKASKKLFNFKNKSIELNNLGEKAGQKGEPKKDQAKKEKDGNKQKGKQNLNQQKRKKSEESDNDDE